jgi:hypothetical protein
MKNIILSAFLTVLLGFLIWLPMITISKELSDLNSKIDKIAMFLDLDLKAEDVVGE